MHKLKIILSYFHPRMPIALVYMLQQVEYKPEKFIKWLLRHQNLNFVMYRKTLVWTKKAQLLVLLGYGVMVVSLATAIMLGLVFAPVFYATIIVMPLAVIMVYVLAVAVAYKFIVQPNESRLIKKAEKIFAESSATKIAVLGSYGKTSMKEMLATVLGDHVKVAVTPGNMNTAIAHARFTNRLDGDEDVIIIEYGEAEPGDIKKYAAITHPNMGILTGVAPNHLDEYKTYDALKAEFIHIKNFIPNEKMYVNQEAGDLLDPFSGAVIYGPEEIGKWHISSVKVDITGTSFTLKTGSTNYEVTSQLIGRHQVPALAVCAMIAHDFKLTKQQIIDGIAKTEPFEHRMQPRNVNGAWVIDDTYNGNIEGMKAGLSLLHELEATRKIYVTPGLVDQGEETTSVHQKLAAAIAASDVQTLVLIKNSTTDIIVDALQTHNFAGEIIIEDNPLEYYTNLEHHLAAGDIVMLQNDWTDNYN